MTDNTGRRHKARNIILQALYQWHLTKLPYDEITEQFCETADRREVDLLYFQVALSGIIKSVLDIDSLIQKALDRQIKQLDPITISILRLSGYELMYQKDIPFKSVINEALLLAKTFGAEDSYKYVNGVLDKLALELREKEIGENNEK